MTTAITYILIGFGVIALLLFLSGFIRGLRNAWITKKMERLPPKEAVDYYKQIIIRRIMRANLKLSICSYLNLETLGKRYEAELLMHVRTLEFATEVANKIFEQNEKPKEEVIPLSPQTTIH